MSVLRAVRAASNVQSSVTWEQLNNGNLWVPAVSGAARSSAGKNVSYDKALTVAGYFGAILLIAQDYARVPVKIREGDSKEDMRRHPAWRLLNVRPNNQMTAFNFRLTMSAWRSGHGNAYAEIVRANDAEGTPLELWPIHPSRVTVKYTDSGELFYRVYSDPNKKYSGTRAVDIPSQNMLHVCGLGDGTTGYSMIQFMANAIGVALTAEEYSASYLENDATPTVVLKYPHLIDEMGANKIREGWKSKYGGPDKRGLPALLENGVDLQVLSHNAKDSALIETRQFQVLEFCQFFRLNPNKLQMWDKVAFNSASAMNVMHATETMGPVYASFEGEYNIKLCDYETTNIYARHNERALMRGDTESEMRVHRERFHVGTINQNEIRELFDEPGIGAEGDIYYVPVNMRPATPEAREAATGSPQQTPNENTTDREGPLAPQEKPEQSLNSYNPVIVDACDRVCRMVEKGYSDGFKKSKGDQSAFGSYWFSFFETRKAKIEDMFRPVAESFFDSRNYISGARFCESLTESECDLMRTLGLRMFVSGSQSIQIDADEMAQRFKAACLYAVMRAKE